MRRVLKSLSADSPSILLFQISKKKKAYTLGGVTQWVAVSREVEQSTRKVGGLIPGSSSLHVEVSLGNILNRELAQIPLALKSTSFTWLLDKMFRYRRKHVYECVCV